VLAGWRSFSRARERYSQVQVPVTLIYGDNDWSRIPEWTRTKELLKNSRFCTLQNSEHLSSVENPEDVARIILALSFKTESQNGEHDQYSNGRYVSCDAGLTGMWYASHNKMRRPNTNRNPPSASRVRC
jgi:hypothetical protein